MIEPAHLPYAVRLCGWLLSCVSFPANVLAMVRLGVYHETLRDALWPRPTFSEDYEEDSAWRR